MVSLILTCAGSGKRTGFDENKLLKLINGKSVIDTAFDAFFDSGLIDEFIITANKFDYDFLTKKFDKRANVVLGGETRTLSIKSALALVSGDIVLIHDGARPFVSREVILDCIETVKQFGSGIASIPTPETIATAINGEILSATKAYLHTIQTPQGFFTKDIKKAYDKLVTFDYPDDSSIYKEFIGIPHLSKGDSKNKKLTFKEDFKLETRVGTGFDCHRLVEDRRLVLGGVVIPHDKGLLGHSDADVLIHAIMDALLSSVGLKDIGYYFSDKDPKFKDIDSTILLKEVLKMVDEKGYKVHNLSAVIMAEKPKLLKFIDDIKENLAKLLDIEVEKVGLTATTLEGLGFVGREEGICVKADVLVESK